MTQKQPSKHTHSPLRHVSRGLAARFGPGRSHLRPDQRGASAILGTMFAFALVVSVVAMVQVSAVPAWNQQTEFEHLTEVERDFGALDESVAAASMGTQSRASVEAGVNYPTRALFLSPAGGAGTVRTTAPATATVSNAVATTSGTAEHWDGTDKTFDAQSLTFQPNYEYLQSSPVFTHEGVAQYTAYSVGANQSEVGATQSLVDGNRISLVLLEGNIDTASGEAMTLGVTPLSAGTDYITVTDGDGPISISVPTHLSNETWHELLEDEPNVLSISYDDSVDPHVVTVTLVPGKEYDLHIARVGIDTQGTLQDPVYIVDIAGDDAVVPPGATHRAVVEVRDAQNNPVPNAVVRVNDAGTDGDVRARDGDSTKTRTDANGRATFLYHAPDSISSLFGDDGTNGIVEDQFDVEVLDENLTTVDRVTFDIELREGSSSTTRRGLVAAVDDPGFAYDDKNRNGLYDGADTKVLPKTSGPHGSDITYKATDGVLVVPPSVGTINTSGSIEFVGKGVSLHTDAVSTGGNIKVDGGSDKVNAIGVSLTATGGDVTVETTDSTVDITGASLSADGEVTIDGKRGVDLASAGVTSYETGGNKGIKIHSDGFVDGLNADLSSQKDIYVDGEQGLSFAGAGLSTAQSSSMMELVSNSGGANLDGIVALADGHISVSTDSGISLVGANVASTKGQSIKLVSDNGKISGREAAIVTSGNTGHVTIKAPTSYISLRHSNIEGGGNVVIEAGTSIDLTGASYPADADIDPDPVEE
ncbi:hemagglutinin repeat-containing protein [Haloferax profundi]|uniref:Big-1 domain-containing protein n=1 Tax=Haloferax profundi TaxID=1544718 RepID=A0A0W1SPV6_9EURY|nr:hemagglutinin repeat-containing protein [Haloferax profundi]KTG28402.1 hypothetical protein AUR66_11905 [Haloferax profundi]